MHLTVHACTCVCWRTCVHTQGKARWQHQVCSFRGTISLFCETAYLPGTHGSLIMLGWLDSEPQASTLGSAQLPSAGVTSICYHSQMVFKIWVLSIQDGSSRLCSKHLGSCAVILVTSLTLLVWAFCRNLTHKKNIR